MMDDCDFTDPKLTRELIFQHSRKSQRELTSRIRVEELIAQNPEIGAIGIMCHDLETVGFVDSEERYGCDHHTASLAWYYAVELEPLSREPPESNHEGECILNYDGCTRCSVERHYLSALYLIKEYKERSQKDYVQPLVDYMLKDTLSLLCDYVQYNERVELLAILIASEDDVRYQIIKFRKDCQKVGILGVTNIENDEVFEFEYKFNKWKTMTEEQKQVWFEKAQRFIDMVKNPPVVKGIPWWREHDTS
jgi:hypothetical protein